VLGHAVVGGDVGGHRGGVGAGGSVAGSWSAAWHRGKVGLAAEQVVLGAGRSWDAGAAIAAGAAAVGRLTETGQVTESLSGHSLQLSVLGGHRGASGAGGRSHVGGRSQSGGGEGDQSDAHEGFHLGCWWLKIELEADGSWLGCW